MTGELIVLIANNITLILLFVALVIFGILAATAKSIKKFQFQISVFIVIWIVGEIIETQREVFMIGAVPFEELGLQIHLASMVFFSVLIWMRYYHSKGMTKKIIDDADDLR